MPAQAVTTVRYDLYQNKKEPIKRGSFSASVGTIFLVRVPGNLTEKLDLVQFTAAKNGGNGRFFINSGRWASWPA